MFFPTIGKLQLVLLELYSAHLKMEHAVILGLVNLRGVSTKLNKYIVFTMQTYKKLSKCFLSIHILETRGGHEKYNYIFSDQI